MPVRLNRLTDAEVRGFLAEHVRPLKSAAADSRSGWRGRRDRSAQALAADDETGKAYRAAGQLLEAVLAGTAAGYERALKQAPFAARGEFTAMLDALADTLGEAARGALGGPPAGRCPGAARHARDPAPLLRAMERVAEAREAA